MTLAAPSLTQPERVDALSPLRFPGDLQLTPEQFWTVCSANPDAVLELDASGHLIHMTPTGGETGARNSTLLVLLGLALRTSGLGYAVIRPGPLVDEPGGYKALAFDQGDRVTQPISAADVAVAAVDGLASGDGTAEDGTAPVADAGADAAATDVGAADVAAVDAGVSDAGLGDAGLNDATLVDATMADAPNVDVGVLDAGKVDAGPCPAVCNGGCSGTVCYLKTPAAPVCPPGWDCDVTCNTGNACAQPVVCATGKCAVHCTGVGTCAMGVNCTTASDPRNYNVPNDGKFDQSTVDNPVELEVGRIDMFGMDQFSKNDTLLVKDYLNRVHNFRLGNMHFRRRGLIDNNFTGLNLASTGYHNIPCFVGLDSFSDAVDYFTEQNSGSYLWSYGCGAGSYNSCNGIGTSTDFLNSKGKFNNAFTMLAGSFFGDWDSKNNLLRASLAAGSLASCWGGIPKWYLHHMAMGVNIGYGAKITQNNANDYFNGNFNGAWNGVFIALMGDPTLTMLQVAPPSNLVVSENLGTTTLKWNASKEKVDGYAIYRIDETKQEWREVSSYCPAASNTTTDTFYTDFCRSTPLGNNQGKFVYAVRAFRWETTGSGSYRNLSMATVGQTITTNTNTPGLNHISVYPNPTQGQVTVAGLLSETTCEIQVLTTSGQTLQRYKGVTSDTGEYRFNLSQISEQLLLIQINQAGRSFTQTVNLTHN